MSQQGIPLSKQARDPMAHQAAQDARIRALEAAEVYWRSQCALAAVAIVELRAEYAELKAYCSGLEEDRRALVDLLRIPKD